MGQFRSALFIVNPNSGKKKIDGLEKSIQQCCNEHGIESKIEFTKGKHHATEIANRGASEKFDLILAVGGDGTVHEVAKALIGTDRVMGILPKGSGNGLARHLGISRKPSQALEQLLEGRVVRIDTIKINDEISVNVSGIGFDGHIANLFGTEGKRGLREYVSLAATEFRRFKPFHVKGEIDHAPLDTDAFILAVANSSQFGNNATVSPTASVCDGLMDVCVIQKVPLLQSLGFAGKMFTRRMNKSAFAKIIKCRKAVFEFESDKPYHIDGEGKSSARFFSFEIAPSSLNVLTLSDKI